MTHLARPKIFLLIFSPKALFQLPISLDCQKKAGLVVALATQCFSLSDFSQPPPFPAWLAVTNCSGPTKGCTPYQTYWQSLLGPDGLRWATGTPTLGSLCVYYKGFWTFVCDKTRFRSPLINRDPPGKAQNFFVDFFTKSTIPIAHKLGLSKKSWLGCCIGHTVFFT